MKKIVAIIRHYKGKELKDALLSFGVKGLTVEEVRGFGKQKSHSEFYKDSEYFIDFIPKTKATLVVPDEKVSSVIEVITKVSKTGRIGDGKIFVIPMDDAVRIRTADYGKTAIE